MSYLSLVAAPLLVAQALYVRRTTPRLPGASGPTEGLVPGAGTPWRLAVLGESTVDGVGAASHEEALTGRLAQALARDGLTQITAGGWFVGAMSLTDSAPLQAIRVRRTRADGSFRRLARRCTDAP